MSIIKRLPAEAQNYVQTYFAAPQVRNYTQEDRNAFGKDLILLSKFLSVPPPDADQIKMIINFLQEEFPSVNSQEFGKAVRKALSRKLGIHEQQLATYNKLSPEWISVIISKYLSIRNKELIKYKDKLRKEKYDNPPPLTEEQKLTQSKSYCTKLFKEFVDTGEIQDFQNWTYLFLESHKIIDITPKDKIRIYNEAKKKFENKPYQSEKVKTLTDIMLGLTGAGEQDRIVHLSRTLALKELFSKLISEGKDIKELLDTIG